MVTVTTTTTTTKTEEKTFPKLMKGKGLGRIVFFTEPKKGLSIMEGRWSEYWDMDYFEDYNEAITLKNE